jgi:hypothetical protein
MQSYNVQDAQKCVGSVAPETGKAECFSRPQRDYRLASFVGSGSARQETEKQITPVHRSVQKNLREWSCHLKPLALYRYTQIILCSTGRQSTFLQLSIYAHQRSCSRPKPRSETIIRGEIGVIGVKSQHLTFLAPYGQEICFSAVPHVHCPGWELVALIQWIQSRQAIGVNTSGANSTRS